MTTEWEKLQGHKFFIAFNKDLYIEDFIEKVKEVVQRYDKVIELAMTDYHEYSIENPIELILRISDGEDVTESVTSDKKRTP